jgi:hypothetical protein
MRRTRKAAAQSNAAESERSGMPLRPGNFPIRLESNVQARRCSSELLIYFMALAEKSLIDRVLSGIIASFCAQQNPVNRGIFDE